MSELKETQRNNDEYRKQLRRTLRERFGVIKSQQMKAAKYPQKGSGI